MSDTARAVRGYTHLPHCLVARYGDTGDDFPWCTCKTDGWPRRVIPAEAGGLDAQNPGRVTPRECIRAARDALSKAYGCGGKRECWPFIMEALDWQRRAVEQLADAAVVAGDRP